MPVRETFKIHLCLACKAISNNTLIKFRQVCDQILLSILNTSFEEQILKFETKNDFYILDLVSLLILCSNQGMQWVQRVHQVHHVCIMCASGALYLRTMSAVVLCTHCSPMVLGNCFNLLCTSSSPITLTEVWTMTKGTFPL